MEQILIRLDYSDNYKSKHQNKIKSAYFGNKSLSLFTACPYYQNGKLPIAITAEENDKSRVTSLSCVNKVITQSPEKLNQQIKPAYIVSDWCASQFPSRLFLAFLRIYTQILPSSGTTTRSTTKRPDGWDWWCGKESSLSQGFIGGCSY